MHKNKSKNIFKTAKTIIILFILSLDPEHVNSVPFLGGKFAAVLYEELKKLVIIASLFP